MQKAEQQDGGGPRHQKLDQDGIAQVNLLVAAGLGRVLHDVGRAHDRRLKGLGGDQQGQQERVDPKLGFPTSAPDERRGQKRRRAAEGLIPQHEETLGNHRGLDERAQRPDGTDLCHHEKRRCCLGRRRPWPDTRIVCFSRGGVAQGRAPAEPARYLAAAH